VAAVFLLVPISGCCAISQALFCGPREPLPRRSYLTPQQSLKTFLAAVSCDDAQTIWESVGPDMKKRMLLSEFEWVIAWNRIKEKTPGIHLAYEAEPRNPKPVVQPASPGRPFPLASFTLSLPGTTIEVQLRKYVYWKVMFQTEDMKQPEEVSAHIPALGDVMKLKRGKNDTKIDLSLPGVPWHGVKLSEILSASAGIEWLVYTFRIIR